MELSSPDLKKLVLFQKRTYKAPKTNKKSSSKKILVSCDVFVICTTAKLRQIPCEYLNVMQYEINESESF